MKSFEDIISRAKKNKKKARLVVAPIKDITALRLFNLPEVKEIIDPILIGNKNEILRMANEIGYASSNHEIIDFHETREAVEKAVSMVNSKDADILMQGNVKNTLFRDIVFDINGVEVRSLVSHISLLENRKINRVIMITDTMINDTPTLQEKCAILENAILLSDVLGIKKPSVALISALEYINPSIPSTTDAAIISKMGERHQFGDVVVDGPLDIDCAVSSEAALRKRVSSPVTGKADIFLVTDVESGYCFSHILSFFGKMPLTGIILGTAAPILLNMPYITDKNRIVEIALAKLLSLHVNPSSTEGTEI